MLTEELVSTVGLHSTCCQDTIYHIGLLIHQGPCYLLQFLPYNLEQSEENPIMPLAKGAPMYTGWEGWEQEGGEKSFESLLGFLKPWDVMMTIIPLCQSVDKQVKSH